MIKYDWKEIIAKHETKQKTLEQKKQSNNKINLGQVLILLIVINEGV